MKYYYVDLATSNDLDVQEYKDFEDFKQGILWNRDIAQEYGDRVISEKKLLKELKPDKEFYIELNGAAFVICENIEQYNW